MPKRPADDEQPATAPSPVTIEQAEEPENGNVVLVKDVHTEQVDDDDSDTEIGPMPPTADGDIVEPEKKKKKVLQFENTFLRSIPKAKCYEKSFMHRDTITHVVATNNDGNVKFWKKQHHEGVEFVKHFRCHIGAINDMFVSYNGVLMCTVGVDKTAKVFEITNFDMINMFRLDFTPRTGAWIHKGADAVCALAVTDSESGRVVIFDGKGEATGPLHTFDKLHSRPVSVIEFVPAYDCVVSIDEAGMVEYWTGPKYDYQFPTTVQWQYKTDTDLYEFAKCKTMPVSLCIAPDGRSFATYAVDRRVRIFRTGTGKLTKVIDETLPVYTQDRARHGLSVVEFNRRMQVERELDRTPESFALQRIDFDMSGNFLLCPCMLGIKCINLTTNECVRVIGKPETLRFLSVTMCRSMLSVTETMQGAATTAEVHASENPAFKATSTPDPMLVVNAFKKNRFYLFTNQEPFDTNESTGKSSDRDIINERPLKQDIITAVEEKRGEMRLTDNCVIHTTFGDIHCRLYLNMTPKTVENFVVHARRGYYNGHVFHRVIKSFMIQTGDPTGSGMGGESIWGGEFEDEIRPELKHDKPYCICMANAGPNTNGSQFFITVVPTPWLDGKHTIFGRVTKGMDVVQEISKQPTHQRSGRPYDEISVVSITLGDHTATEDE